MDKFLPLVMNNKKIVGIAIVGVVIIGGIILFPQSGRNEDLQTNEHANSKQSQPTDEEAKALVATVGKLIDLPEGEDPTVATITDISKLADQPFFAKAQNGDKVLIYTQNKKAILFRPGENKIMEVAQVNIGATAGVSTQSGETKAPITKVVIYNGTSTVGYSNTIEKELQDKATNIEVVAKENAKKKDYKKTVVIDINGEFTQASEQLAELLKGEVGTLPEGEEKPEADILIIAGK